METSHNVRVWSQDGSSSAAPSATGRNDGPFAHNHRHLCGQSTHINIPAATDSAATHDPSEEADHFLPTDSPTTTNSNSNLVNDRVYFPYQPKSLAGIATRSFCLGIAVTIGVGATGATLLYTLSPLWRLPFFLAALATFHFLEFWTTAAYNTRAADVKSFLLTANWPGYAIAHGFATLECLLTNTFFPNRVWAPFGTGALLCLAGLALTVIGQVVRSVAMVQAGPSFNHLVQRQRSSAHVLVTSGIYGKFRHPSYFGFFWWALGTQMAMGNVISFVAYTAVLWKFFSSRIKHEEEFLVKFFGQEYVDYRRRVGTKIPFVP